MSYIEAMIVPGRSRLQVDSLCSLHEPFYGPSQSYEDFYKYHWFHKTILLMYLLSLTIVGDILYSISYYGQFSTDAYTGPLVPLVKRYAVWIGFNVAIVWMYTILCVVLLTTVEAKHMEEWQSMEEAQDMEEALSLHWIRGLHTGPKRLWILSLVWYGIVLALVGCSITYDVVHNEDKGQFL